MNVGRDYRGEDVWRMNAGRDYRGEGDRADQRERSATAEALHAHIETELSPAGGQDAHAGGFSCASITLFLEVGMRHPQKARREALHQVQRFMDDNAVALGGVNQSRSRALLDDVIKSLAGSGATQSAAQAESRSRTDQKQGLREELRMHHMAPISAIARTKLADTPAITRFRLPVASTDDLALLDAAEGMAEAAAQYKSVFVDEMLPATFIEELRASAAAVRQAVGDRTTSRQRLRSATKATDNELVRGRSVVRILNSLVVKQLAKRTDLLAAWQQAKHPRAKGGVPRGTVSGATPEVAAAA